MSIETGIEPHDGWPCTPHIHHKMDCSEFDALRARAADRCEACGITKGEAPRQMLCIDHDHRYGMGAVRGILCMPCNSQLGALDNGRNSVMRTDLDQRFGPYVRKAWHMQIVNWARTRDDLLGNPDFEAQTLNDAVLRFSTVREATKLIGRMPTVTSRWVAHPGHTGLRITAAYDFGSPYKRHCAVLLSRGDNNAMTLDCVRVHDSGRMAKSVDYHGFTQARPHLTRLLAIK